LRNLLFDLDIDRYGCQGVFGCDKVNYPMYNPTVISKKCFVGEKEALIGLEIFLGLAVNSPFNHRK